MYFIKRLYHDSRVLRTSAVELKKAERALGVLFPDEYKGLFLKTNGVQFGKGILYPVPIKRTVSLYLVRHYHKRPAANLICIGEHLTGDKPDSYHSI